MSSLHLEQLQKKLDDNHWIILEKLSGNNYNYSALWKISRPNRKKSFTLAFEGLDDLTTLPVEKSFGCTVLEYKTITLYFSKIGKSWPKLLEQFISQLNALG